jgi:hypothetical protein
MANKDQRRGNRETRKPKQPKAKPAVAISPFTPAWAATSIGKAAKKK